jgi:protein-S-isoprenylcysteine O-methyltransferase Ste14
MSIRSMSILAWVTSMAFVWAVFTPSPLSFTGLVWVSVLGFVALSIGLTVAARSPRSLAQVIADAEAEPTRGVARLARVALPVFGPVNRMKGDGPR